MRVTIIALMAGCFLADMFASSAQAAKLGWRWQNRSGQTLNVELYSDIRDGHVWPGNNRTWVVPSDGVIYVNPISCKRGERICYGAWIGDGTGDSWGVGKAKQHSCANCCFVCNGRQTDVIVFRPTTASGSASAPRSCNPRFLGANILNSPNQSDIHPDWVPPNSIGTAWSLQNISLHGEFYSGTIFSPRGGEQPGRVYVIASEWDCQR
jgi:hypothetical protein